MKNILILTILINHINFCLNSKLLNTTELTDCAQTTPQSRDDCIQKNYTTIVCCYYKMTFPINANICNGASKSSAGLKREPVFITLAGDIRVQGGLDCNIEFYKLKYFIYLFFVFLI